jgi:YD repeat-containing protein
MSESRTRTKYLYDGRDLLEEVDASGNVLARYTQGAYIDEPLAESRAGSTSYYEQDALGSVTSLSSAAGSVVSSYAYDSYGNLSRPDRNRLVLPGARGL